VHGKKIKEQKTKSKIGLGLEYFNIFSNTISDGIVSLPIIQRASVSRIAAFYEVGDGQ
jgi:hypothetical protein